MTRNADDCFYDSQRLEEIISFLAEGVIVLDDAGRLVWVNDAALRMHGVETPKELGKTCEDYAQRFELRYRNNHKLSADAYPMSRALAGDLFRDVVVEVRKAEETKAEDDACVFVHSVRSCRSDSQSDGKRFFLIITDLTQQVEAEKRFEAAFNANPAPAVICRLSDLHYIKVNPGFLEMTGYTRDDIIGHSAYEIDVLTAAQKRDLALERLREHRTIPQMEAEVPLPGGGKKCVIVAGEPIQIENETSMLFTFADLDPLKSTEHALRQSEERFSKSFHLSPVPQLITTLKDFRVTEINQAFRDLLGYTAEESIGWKASDLIVWEDKIMQRKVETSIEKTGGILSIDLTIQTKDAIPIDCLISAATVTIADERCVLWALQDITDRKHSEDELVSAIEAVMEDTSWFSRTVVEKLAGLRRPARPLLSSVGLNELTERERDILGLICQGQSDGEMSDTLGLSPNTIRNHVSSLFHKIGVNRRAAAIIWARERGVSGRDGVTQTGKPRLKAKPARKKSPPKKTVPKKT
jgi:PAS domain S-box-containing protein